MKVTVDTGGLLYEFTEPEGWDGSEDLSDWDRKLLEMTLRHVLATVTSPVTRGGSIPATSTIIMNSPPKGRLS